MIRTTKWVVNSLWILVLLPALSVANITLPGDRHIGDSEGNLYTPSDYITPAQTQNNPLHFSLSSDLTITAIRINNVFAEFDPGYYVDYFRVEIDGTLVGSAVVDDGTTVIPISPLSLSSGVHRIAIYPDCTPDADCENNDIVDNDITFPSVDLISTGTSTNISFNRRYHVGDSRIGNDEYGGRLYPDSPDTDLLSLQFTLANESTLTQVTFYNVRDVSGGCDEPNNVYLDKNNPSSKIGEIDANGELVITTNMLLSAGSHILIIESGSCSGNGNNADYDDISWDDIILEFTDTTVGSFLIDAPTSGSTCIPIAVDIQALKNNGDLSTNYNKQIQISTSSGHGDWVLTDGVGTFTENPGDDNGVAFYEFVSGGSGDGGAISLTLFNTHADDLTISVVEVGDASTLSTTSTITFRDNAFVITDNYLATDPLNNIPVAGRDHSMHVALWTRDGLGGANCQINDRYDYSNLQLEARVDRSLNDPGGAPPSINGGPGLPNVFTGYNVTLDFVNGEADFVLNTSDVGKYGLTFLDDSSGFAKDETGNPLPITGGTTSLLTVRPFGFAFSGVPTNSGSNGPIVSAAGDSFNATITAVAWQNADDGDGDGLRDAGANLNDNATTPAYAATTQLSAVAPFTPASGVLGLLNGGSVSIAFSGGSASPTNLQYSEVGEVTLLAQIDDYLGTGGADVQSRSALVGRFTPDHFDMTVSQGCSVDNFTYSGQPLSSVKVMALNAMGDPTLNYFGNFAKELTFIETVATGALTNTVGVASEFTNGVANYADLPTFTFTLKESPPENVALTVSDTDGVSSTTPVTMNIRSGRIALQDVAGSELLPLIMPVAVQYFDSGWQTNTLDTMCTVLDTTDFSFVTNAVGTTIGNPINDTGDGTWTLPLSAPGTTGFADITADGIPQWLQDDWDEDGTVYDYPQARASFGLYNGNEKQIYIRQGN